MNVFPLKIITPKSMVFDGMAQELMVRTLTGDAAILAGHADYLAALADGKAMVKAEGTNRYAHCRGGLVSVKNSSVTLLPTSFTWTTAVSE